MKKKKKMKKKKAWSGCVAPVLIEDLLKKNKPPQ